MVPLESQSQYFKQYNKFKINCFFFFLVTSKAKKAGTVIGHKTIMSQCGFTALEDSDASPVSVTL